jgi:hypothetical protein
MKYLEYFSFICPHCQAEFYKDLYAVKKTKEGEPYFEIPEYVKNDRASIQCPMIMRLNMKTGQKEHVSGCGKTFKWSQRRRIKFSAEKFIAYDAKDLIDKLFNLPEKSPIIMDEAFKILAGQSHNKAENKYIKEILTVVRPRKFFMMLLLPEVQWLDSKVREGFSSFWLRMIERGTGVLLEKDKGESRDKYHLREMEDILGNVRFFTPMNKIKRKIQKHPCYFDMFTFPELPEKVYAEYELVRNAVNLQRQVEEMEFNTKDVAKLIVWNIMSNWDRIKISVDKSKENRPTYSIMTSEIMIDPVTRRSLVSEPTLRNWNKGVEEYVKTKGKDVKIFDGDPMK